MSWVSRRLALVAVLPEAIQRQGRERRILAQAPTADLIEAISQLPKLA